MSVDSRALVGGLAVAMSVVIVVSVLSGEPAVFDDRTGGSVLRNLIYDFQTLLTGVLALFSAWWTIGQMRESDRLQERRHRQLLTSSERKEKLAVDRLLQRLPEALEYHTSRLERYLRHVPNHGGEPTWKLQAVRDAHVAIGAVKWLARIDQDKRVIACRDLFDADVDLQLECIGDWARTINSMLPEQVPWTKMEAARPDWYAQMLDPSLDDLASQCRIALDSLKRWAVDPLS